ncbi:uncharacterized protein LOC133883022 [Alnus glutinosa]|uniref:uncharacterized protein LOC133883022 n=1 Tax=Alnus glutinosa TaxID=3517 RepID=UPI002D797DC9|nr:uncharacterized protein LOC133883022 [Alnus glutinosa]
MAGATSTGWREPASPVMLSGGPREPDPPDPDAPRPFFRGFFDKIGSCLNFLCCCWLLKNCFGGPLGPPEAPRRPDPPGPPGRHDGVKELARPPHCQRTPACTASTEAGGYAMPTHDSSTHAVHPEAYSYREYVRTLP